MKPFIIAGPCVVESFDIMETIAKEIVRLKQKYNIDIIFKASCDKANRTSLHSYRGLGFYTGLGVLKSIKEEYSLSITTDIHETSQVLDTSKIVDIIQIPALLSRQTDLITTVANTGKTINIKKGQFMSYKDIAYAVSKSDIYNTYVTERGTCFGYNDIVVDFRNLYFMRGIGAGIIMDCSHSVQTPNTEEGKSGGNRDLIIPMALAAKSFGVQGYFVETHPNPMKAKSDGPSSLPLYMLETFVKKILE